MTIDISKPDYVYNTEDAVRDGALIDLFKDHVRIWFEGKPIMHMSYALWHELAEFGFNCEAISALLHFITFIGEDTAAEGEPKGFLFECPPQAALNDRKVWLVHYGDGWTVMFPEDY